MLGPSVLGTVTTRYDGPLLSPDNTYSISPGVPPSQLQPGIMATGKLIIMMMIMMMIMNMIMMIIVIMIVIVIVIVIVMMSMMIMMINPIIITISLIFIN